MSGPIYNQNFNSGKTVATNIYLGVDSSGNFHPDTSNNTASLQAVSVTANTVSASAIRATTLSFQNLDVSGNLTIAANLTVNGTTTFNGFTTIIDDTDFIGNVDVSGTLVAKSVSALTLATPGGFSVDASGRVISVSVNTGPVVASSLDVSGAVVAVSVTTGPVVAVSLDVSGAIISSSVSTGPVVASSVSSKTLATTAGFLVDASGSIVVPGNSILNSLTVDKSAIVNQSINVQQGMWVGGGAYVDSEYINILTIGDSSDGDGVTMESSGSTLNIFGLTQDLSATVFPITVNVNGPVISSLFSAPDGGFNAPGFSIDSSGDVQVSGDFTSSGFNIDTSGNVSVPGQFTVESTSVFNSSVSIDKTFYVGTSSFVNQEYASKLTVGDSSEGDGVTMESSGTTLNIFGVTQDTSAILFPVNVNINGSMATTGGFSVDSSGAVVAAKVNVNGGLSIQNSYNFNTITDSSGTFINIDSSNTSVPVNSTQVPDYSMPIYINGVAYLINLKKL